MFTSKQTLIRKSGKKGVDRPQYIQELMNEYSTSTNKERQKQVVANLANFSYDPLNFKWLLEAGVPQIFLDILKDPHDSPQLRQFAFAGISNLTVDEKFCKFYVEEGVINIVNSSLASPEADESHLISALGIAFNLLNCQFGFLLEETYKLTIPHQKSVNKRIQNLAIIFTEDFSNITK